MYVRYDNDGSTAVCDIIHAGVLYQALYIIFWTSLLISLWYNNTTDSQALTLITFSFVEICDPKYEICLVCDHELW